MKLSGAKAAGVIFLLVLVVAGSTTQGFNPQPDPPGFGMVTLQPDQIIRLNVVCFDHQVGRFPPGPCRGSLMFHDAVGTLVRGGNYSLQPGQTASLDFAAGRLDSVDGSSVPTIINPCVIPAPGGYAIPTVEVIDRSTGHVSLFANPAAARMSDFSNGRGNPGERVGFNPQPDPPGFGGVSVAPDQALRLNVSCFSHEVGGLPPGPCRGTVMIHDAQGNVMRRGSYRLQPGQTSTIEFAPGTDVGADVTMIPCVLPAPGGRVVPTVEIADMATGRTALFLNPAVARVSDLAR